MAQAIYFYWKWEPEEGGGDAPLEFDERLRIAPAIGAHGIGSQYDDYEVGLYFDQEKQAFDGKQPGCHYLPTDPTLTPRQFLERQYGPPPVAPVAAARLHGQAGSAKVTISQYPIIEFIVMGKLHRYYAVEGLFEQIAPLYRKALVLEGRSLNRQAQNMKETYTDLMANQGFVKYLVDAAQTIRGWVGPSLPKLEPAKFYDVIHARCEAAQGRLTHSGTVSYVDLHDVGIEFMRIRRRLVQVDARCAEALRCLVESAETGQHSAEFVEEYAFKILDLYGQVRFAGNDFGLATYRVLMGGLRAAARGGSAYFLSDDKTGAVRAAMVDQVIPALKKDMPPVFSKLIIGKLGPAARRLGWNQGRAKVAFEQIGGLLIDVLFDFLIWEVYDKDHVKWEKFQDDETSKLPLKIVAVVVAVVKGAEGDEDSDRAAKRREEICDILLAVIEAVSSDMEKLRERAEHEGTKPLEIFLSEPIKELQQMCITFAAALAMDAAVKPAMKKSEMARQIAALLNGRPSAGNVAATTAARFGTAPSSMSAGPSNAPAPPPRPTRSTNYFAPEIPAYPAHRQYDAHSPRRAPSITKVDAAVPNIAVGG